MSKKTDVILQQMFGPDFKKLQKMSEEMEKKENEVLRKLFGGYIKQSFLIKMKELIKNNPRFILLMTKIYDILDVSYQKRLMGSTDYNYDLCKFITAIHNDNCICLNDIDKTAKYSDINYQKSLQEEVIDFVAIRPFGALNINPNSIEGYTPIVYIINAINNLMIEKMTEAIKKNSFKKVENYKFKLSMLNKMIIKIKTCIVLIDNCLMEEAFTPLRSIIELLMIYLCLKDRDQALIDRYTAYVGYNFNYTADREIDETVKKEFKANVKNKNITIIDYLNFGWIDSIFEYGYIEDKDRTYKQKDLKEILNMIFSKSGKSKVGDSLYNVYRQCNPMSHGFNGTTNQYSNKISIALNLAFLLTYLKEEVKEVIDIDYTINGVALIEKLENIRKSTRKHIDEISGNKDLESKINSQYIIHIS